MGPVHPCVPRLGVVVVGKVAQCLNGRKQYLMLRDEVSRNHLLLFLLLETEQRIPGE